MFKVDKEYVIKHHAEDVADKMLDGNEIKSIIRGVITGEYRRELVADKLEIIADNYLESYVEFLNDSENRNSHE